MSALKENQNLSFAGDHTVRIPRRQLWGLLHNPEVLRHCIHRCEAVERHTQTRFSACFTARIGPLKKRFRAQLEIGDARPPDSYTLRCSMDAGVAGAFSGAAGVSLTAVDATTTRVRYTSEVAVQGWLGQFGARLLRGRAEKYMERFFTALEIMAAQE